MSGVTMTMTLPDGTQSAPFTGEDLKRVADEIQKRIPMKDDADFKKHNQDAYRVTAEELRQFIERAETLAAEKRGIAEQEKENFDEAKGRGYDTKVMRRIIALRKRKPGEVAEEEAVLEIYKSALGMA